MTSRPAMVAAVAAACALGGAAPASARPARIAFDADAAIYTMDADGSNRARLTRGTIPGPLGDSTPLWSPDASTIVFERYVRRSRKHPNRPPSGIWAMRTDGSGKRPILAESGRTRYDLLAVSPTGRVLYLRIRDHRKSDRATVVLMSADLDGSDRKRLTRLDSQMNSVDISVSPDAKRILFTVHRDDANYLDHPSLYVIRTDGTHRRRVAREAQSGAWSPSGKRIVFASVADRNGQTCSSDSCEWNGEIYTMDLEGRNRVRLTDSTADDRHPRWSPDGARILFDSDRNFEFGWNREIYSIAPDGTCLTWLTNGSAWSDQAEWRPVPGDDSTPGACGGGGREPLIEPDLSSVRSFDEAPSWWLGLRAPEGIFLAGASFAARGAPWAPGPYTAFSYNDCGLFDPEACGPPLQVVNSPTCTFTDGVGKLSTLRIQRGVLVGSRGRDDWTTAFAGATSIAIRGTEDYARVVVDRLRGYGEAGPSGDLPETRLPRSFWRKLRRVEESYARTQDEQETADELGISRKKVHQWRLTARKLRELGVDGRLPCPAPQT